MFISKPASNMETSGGIEILSSQWRLWLEGFLINTINPFSVIFGTGIITTRSVETNLFSTSSYLFFGSILGTIIFTDTFKIFLAEKIRSRLQPSHILKMRKISGLALFIFGIAMMVRVTLI